MVVEFYQDRAKRLIQPTLFSDQADKLAKDVADSGKDQRGNLRKNKRSQIRKFYDEVLRLKASAENETWENILPYVNMLNAKAAYALGRDYITPNFLAFIKESVAQINEPADLDVFANLFEAFMGFYRQYGD